MHSCRNEGKESRERGLTEVEGNEELMADQGPIHRHARDGLEFHQDVCPQDPLQMLL